MVCIRCRGGPPCQPEQPQGCTCASFILFDLFRFERFLPRIGTTFLCRPLATAGPCPVFFKSRLRREILQIYPNQSEDSVYSARRFLFFFLTYNVHELRTYNVHEYLFMVDYMSLINGHSCEKWLHTLVAFNRSAWRFPPVIVHPGLLFAKRFRLLSYRLSAVRAGTGACPYSGCIQRLYSLRQAISVCYCASLTHGRSPVTSIPTRGGTVYTP